MERAELEAKYGEVWNTQELQRDFMVESFGGGLTMVTRKGDGVKGSLDFQHSPRYYYDFQKAL